MGNPTMPDSMGADRHRERQQMARARRTPPTREMYDVVAVKYGEIQYVTESFPVREQAQECADELNEHAGPQRPGPDVGYQVMKRSERLSE